jgi:membrane fusion protein (multidrug efflux system)
MQRSPIAPVISTTLVKEENYQASLKAVGTLYAEQGVNLTAQADAVITNIYFPSSAMVKKGDVILKQESNTEQAAVKQTEVELNLAKANYERGEPLFKKFYLSKQEFEELQEKYFYADATYHKAKAELDKRIVIAPFDGKLGIFPVQVGDYVTKGQFLVALTNLDELYVDFFVPEKYINVLKEGDVIELTTAIDSSKVFNGKISLLNTVINNQTYMLKVRATLDNKNHLLRPGGFANVVVYYGPKKNVLTIPQTAIVYSNKGNYVYKLKDNQVYTNKVTLGEQIGQLIIVESGLHQGDIVVSAGTNKLHDGMRVQLSDQIKK